MNANTLNWLKKAEEDLVTCELLLQSEYFPAAVVCFHSQQMAEKIIKAYLTEKEVYFQRTHDLTFLLFKYLIPIDPDFTKIKEPCEYLTDFGVLPRYPGDYEELDSSIAKEAFSYAMEIKNCILEYLNRS